MVTSSLVIAASTLVVKVEISSLSPSSEAVTSSSIFETEAVTPSVVICKLLNQFAY